MDREQTNAGRIDACYDEIRTDVALVSEEVLLEHRHAGYDAGLAAGGEGVELELGGDEGGCEFGVGGGSCSCTPNLGGDVVELFTVLVCYYGTACCSGICGNLGEMMLAMLIWH